MPFAGCVVLLYLDQTTELWAALSLPLVFCVDLSAVLCHVCMTEIHLQRKNKEERNT